MRGLSPAEIDVVAVSTSDPAKTLGRVWPGSKERYYAGSSPQGRCPDRCRG